MITVAIVDDEPLIRAGIAARIDAHPDLSVVGQAADGDEAAALVQRTRPDVMLMDLRSAPMTGKQLEQALDAVHITANKNMIPNDPRKPNETSGLRLGTPAVTTRGMREDSMAIIGRCIADALYQRRPAKEIATEVLSLTQKYSQYL